MNTSGLKATMISLVSLIVTGVIIYFIFFLVAGIIKFFLVAGVIILAIGIIYKYTRSLFKKK